MSKETPTDEGEQLAADYESGRRIFTSGRAKSYCENSQQEFGWEMAQESEWDEEDERARDGMAEWASRLRPAV